VLGVPSNAQVKKVDGMIPWKQDASSSRRGTDGARRDDGRRVTAAALQRPALASA
jgi:hypothetical protein